MYEKPQYMTPGGYRRINQKPSHIVSQNQNKLQYSKSKSLLSNQFKQMNKNQIFISKETARLIAMTIKGLLRG